MFSTITKHFRFFSAARSRRPGTQCWIFALIALFGVGQGGVRAEFKPGTVYKDWTSRLAELGILPVFPPREDVVVGDIYLLPMHPGAGTLAAEVGGLGMTGVHTGFLSQVDDWSTNPPTQQPIAVALSNYYRIRPNFPDTAPPATGSSPTDSNALPLISVPGAQSNGVPVDVFGVQTNSKLRQVAFPEFTATSSSEIGVSALVPIEGFLAGAGFNFTSVKSVSVKISQAESYGLPSDWLLTSFFGSLVVKGQATGGKPEFYLLTVDQPSNLRKSNAPLSSASALLARAMFDQVLTRTLNEHIKRSSDRKKLFNEVRSGTNFLYLTVISEVFYARAMDISVEFNRGGAGGVTAKPVSVGDLMDLSKIGQADASGHTIGGDVTNQAPSSARVKGEDAIALAERLRQLNLGQTGVGGSIRVVSATGRSLGLRRTFERPVAVGVRGIVLKIDKNAVDFDDPTNPGAKARGFPISLSTFEPMRQ